MLRIQKPASDDFFGLGRLPLICALLLVLAFTSIHSFAQTTYTQSYLPSAYGTYAFVGNTVLVGQTAPASLAGTCGTSLTPLQASATAAAVSGRRRISPRFSASTQPRGAAN